MQALPPAYVRRVILRNTTQLPLKFNVQFQQNTSTFTAEAGATVEIENTIDHGDWQAVDPVEKITAQSNDGVNMGESLIHSDAGVKIVTINVRGDSNSGITFEEESRV
jgi:hypothetical protein